MEENILNIKKNVHLSIFTKEVTFLLAYLNDQAVGSLILIHSKDYIEVDNVLTKAEFRKIK